MVTGLGSVEAGKLVDFTGLEKGPYNVGTAKLCKIKVRGTVFEGRVAPAKATKHQSQRR